MAPGRKRGACTSPANPVPSGPADVQSQLGAILKRIDELTKKSDEIPTMVNAHLNGQFIAQQGKMQEQKVMLKELSSIAQKQQEALVELQEEVNTLKSAKTSYIDTFPMKKKKFSIMHTFGQISQLPDDETAYGASHNHFGVHWQAAVLHKERQLAILLVCSVNGDREEGDWSITTNCKYILHMPNGEKLTKTLDLVYEPTRSSCGAKIGDWAAMMEEATVNEAITVEVEVIITEMCGVVKPSPRSFDEGQVQFADVVLQVGGQHFYVLKKFLASKCTYFQEMFFPISGNHEESDQQEIIIPDVSSRAFKAFLEVLHGKHTLDDYNVEHVLFLADMYKCADVIRTCEKYLLYETEKTSATKFRMALSYKLTNLALQFIARIESMEDIREVMKQEMPGDVRKALMERQMLLYDKERGTYVPPMFNFAPIIRPQPMMHQ